MMSSIVPVITTDDTLVDVLTQVVGVTGITLSLGLKVQLDGQTVHLCRQLLSQVPMEAFFGDFGQDFSAFRQERMASVVGTVEYTVGM